MNKSSTLRKLLVGLFVLAGTLQLQAQDGALDLSFDPRNGFQAAFGSGDVNAVVIQPDGKIIAAGQFLTYNGTDRQGIARLHPDGTLDTTFKPGTGFTNGANSGVVNALALQSDGKIIAGGLFTQFNGTPYKCIVRLNSDGSIDKSFNPGTGFNDFRNAGSVLSLLVQPDGKILAGGNFIKFNDSARSGIARLNADGSLDGSFQPGDGFTNTGTIKGQVSAMALQSDGKILAGGQFINYNGQSVKSIIRLSSDGKYDASFNTGAGLDNGFSHARVGAIVLQPDGKILIGGYFNKANTTDHNAITRLNTNGSIDATFQPGKGFQDVDVFGDENNGEVLSIALQPDGKIVAGGIFVKAGGKDHNNIARLQPDGALDNSFVPGKGFLGAKGKVSSLALQSDGKVFAGGSFETYNDTSRITITRLFAYIPALVIVKLDPQPNYCAGTKLNIDFNTGSGSFSKGNVFTAELSDANGSFAKPVSIGTLSGTTSGTIAATIPVATSLGKGYRIRIVGSTPVLNGPDNGTDIQITGIPVVTAKASATDICEGDEVTLTGGGASKYVWDKKVEDGKPFVPKTTETYKVTGYTGDCSASADVKVAVHPYPKVSITASEDTLCANESLTLSGTGATTYNWDNNVKNGVAFYPGKTNTYTLAGTTDGCSDTARITIVVHDTSTTTYIQQAECDSFVFNGVVYKESGNYTQTLVNAAGCDSICVLDITINSVTSEVTQEGRTLTATESGATYQWVNCDQNYQPIIGANEQRFSSNVDGNYAVIVTKNGCSDTSGCFTVKSTGIGKYGGNDMISVYPNPAQRIVHITAPAASAVTISGMDGRILWTQPASEPVEVTGLNSGVYLFYIRDKGGKLLHVEKVARTEY